MPCVGKGSETSTTLWFWTIFQCDSFIPSRSHRRELPNSMWLEESKATSFVREDALDLTVIWTIASCEWWPLVYEYNCQYSPMIIGTFQWKMLAKINGFLFISLVNSSSISWLIHDEYLLYKKIYPYSCVSSDHIVWRDMILSKKLLKFNQ